MTAFVPLLVVVLLATVGVLGLLLNERRQTRPLRGEHPVFDELVRKHGDPLPKRHARPLPSKAVQR